MENNGESGRACDSGNVTPVTSLIGLSSRWRLGSDSEMEEVNENEEESEHCGVEFLPRKPSEDLSDSPQESEVEAPKLKLPSRRHTLQSLRVASMDVPSCYDGGSVPASPRISICCGRPSIAAILQHKFVTRSASFDQGCKSETHGGWISLKVNVVTTSLAGMVCADVLEIAGFLLIQDFPGTYDYQVTVLSSLDDS